MAESMALSRAIASQREGERNHEGFFFLSSDYVQVYLQEFREKTTTIYTSGSKFTSKSFFLSPVS